MSSKTSYFGPPSPPLSMPRPSFRNLRSFSTLLICICGALFFFYVFSSSSTTDSRLGDMRFPQAALHSGLSDPPPGLYKDRPLNPFAGTIPNNDGLHHSLQEEGKDKPESSHDRPGIDDDEEAVQQDEHDLDSEEESSPSGSVTNDKTTAEKPSQEKPTEDKPAEEKPAEEKPAADKPTDEKPSQVEAAAGDAFTIIADSKNGATGKTPTNPDKLTTTVVVGRTDSGVNGTQWIYDDLDDITSRAIYIVDDPEAPLHLEKNKGREAMVYMKYIVEHYDTLSDVTIFFHSGRTAWHNNVLLNKDGAIMINNLRRQHVLDEGYFNLRCELHPGCPRWVQWNASTAQNRDHHPERYNDLFSAAIWDEMFPQRTHDPVWLAEPCCSQYALSRDKIRSRPLADYVRIHDFLFASRIGDGFLGRVMEYVWQFLWLDKDEHCPSMIDCYCKGYGICMNGDDGQALEDWNQCKSEEDELLTKLGKYDFEHCSMFEDGDEKRECKKANPVNSELGTNRRMAGSLMEGHLKKYIIKELH